MLWCSALVWLALVWQRLRLLVSSVFCLCFVIFWVVWAQVNSLELTLPPFLFCLLWVSSLDLGGLRFRCGGPSGTSPDRTLRKLSFVCLLLCFLNMALLEVCVCVWGGMCALECKIAVLPSVLDSWIPLNGVSAVVCSMLYLFGAVLAVLCCFFCVVLCCFSSGCEIACFNLPLWPCTDTSHSSKNNSTAATIFLKVRGLAMNL